MFKQTILATATAGLIAVGALGMTTSAASAGGYSGSGSGSGAVQFGGPGWNLQFGFGNSHPQFHQQKFCKPVVKKVKYWDRWGNPHWTQVVVGQKCFRPQNNGHHNGPWNNNGPGWGGGW
jgi:hypothetical protein